MQKDNIVAIIMAGGLGTRFWPLSTKTRPKQFISLYDEKSLLQKSYERISNIIPNEKILVLTNDIFTKIVKEQLPDIPEQNIIGEPHRKDTAAAVCLGTLISRKLFDNPVNVILTADHLIEPVEVFQKALLSAAAAAKTSDALYTFGITPTYPASEYGYLKIGDKIDDYDGVQHFNLLSFKEKPDKQTAQQYCKSGQYMWNSGMFVWSSETILKELSRQLPDLVDHLSRAVEYFGTKEWNTSLSKELSAVKKISIDFGVMENAKNIRCVEGQFSWKDMGNWLSIQEFIASDENENYIKGNVYTLNSKNNLIYSIQNEETIAIIGIDDSVIVRTQGKTLIIHKSQLENIKKVIENIE